MELRGNAAETRKQGGCIHPSPVRHVDAGLDIDAIRRRMEHQKMKMMRDRQSGSRICRGLTRIWRIWAPGHRPRSGSQP